MTDKPIIFSAPMVRALLDRRKTQTRRVIKAGKYLPEFCGGRYDDKNDPSNYGWEDHERGEWITLDQWRHWNFVPYRKSYHLWVREAWRSASCYDDLAPSAMSGDEPVRYEADAAWQTWGWGAPLRGHGRYRHARFMPRWASRLTLTVTDVRVQRLQDISEADAVAEGIDVDGDGRAWGVFACDLFEDLWNILHGPDAWDANPWVCALTFTVQSGNIDQVQP